MFKKFIISVLMLAMAGSAAAATLLGPSGGSVLLVGNRVGGTDWAGWSSSSSSISAGDELYFEIHFFANGGSVNNVMTKLEDLDGETFSDGDSEVVSAFIEADNATRINDSVTLNFQDDVELVFETFSYREGDQSSNCTSSSCESGGGSSTAVLSSAGYNTGSHAQNSYGNMIVKFRVESNDGGSSSNEEGDVSTDSATSVDEDSARLNGEVEDVDMDEVWFAFSESDSTPSCSSSSQRENQDGGDTDEGDSFYTNVTGLDEDTTYYFRACGEDVNGNDVEGSVRNFTTDEEEEVVEEGDVSTDSATDIEEDTAILRGEVQDGDLYSVWFAISETDTTPSCLSQSDVVDANYGGTDEGDDFGAYLIGLDSDERYYFRACGMRDDASLVSGDVRNFTTDEEEEVVEEGDVSTDSATSVDEDSARLNGEVEDVDMDEVWFAFSESDSTPSCSSSSQRENQDGGDTDEGDSFYTNVTGLDEDTTYYFRACGEDVNGNDVEGSVRNFTTDEEEEVEEESSDDAEVTTYAVAEHAANSAKLKGRVTEGDNVNVWFAFSDSDTTPECNSESEEVSVSGRYDEGQYFYALVGGLDDDTEYYYRACGEDNSGSVKDFTTDETDDGAEAEVTTNEPSSIGTTTVQLNGHVMVNGTDDAEVYFVFGRDSNNLNSTTTLLEVNSDTYFQAIQGLVADTTYYYQAVVESDGDVIDRGIVRDFKTNAVAGVAPRPVTNTPVVTEVETSEGLVVSKEVSYQKQSKYGLDVYVNPGDEVFYKVRVSNDSTEDVTDIIVKDNIPAGLEMGENTNYNDSNKSVTWEIELLEAGESKIFITPLVVSDNVDEGERFSSWAEITSGDSGIEKTNRVEVIIFEEGETTERNGQGASIFGANGIFPSTALGWLGMIVLVMLVGLIIAKFLQVNNTSKLAHAQLRKEEEQNMR